MSDSLTTYTLQKTQTQPSTTQPISDDTGWSLVSNPAANATSATDSTIPPVWYRLKQTTANGVVVPFTIPSLSSVQSGAILLGRLFGGVKANPGGLSNASQCYVLAGTVDPSGNLLICGKLVGHMGSVDCGDVGVIGGIDFGDGVVYDNSPGCGASQNVFLAKYKPDGTLVWVKDFGANSNDAGWGVACDAAGNIYLAASISTGLGGVLDYGFGVETVYGGADVLVVKYSSSGVVLNHKLWGSDNSSGNGPNDLIQGIAVDASGNVIIVGYYGQGFTVPHGPNFGGGALTIYGDTSGVSGKDAFVVKLDSNLNHVWSKGWGGSGDDWAKSVAVDAAGDVYVCGKFSTVDGSHPANFGSGSVFSGAPGVFSGFLAKYSGSTGNNIWFRQFGSPGAGATSLDAPSVTVDPFGNVYCTGNFVGTIDFQGGTETSQSAGSIFVVKYSSTGTYQSSRQSGNTDAGPTALCVACGADGRAVVSGQILNSVDFGNGWLLSAGNNTFIVKYDTVLSATPLWSKITGPIPNTTPHAHCIDRGNGLIYLFGDDGDPGADIWNGATPSIVRTNTNNCRNNNYWYKIAY